MICVSSLNNAPNVSMDQSDCILYLLYLCVCECKCKQRCFACGCFQGQALCSSQHIYKPNLVIWISFSLSASCERKLLGLRQPIQRLNIVPCFKIKWASTKHLAIFIQLRYACGLFSWRRLHCSGHWGNSAFKIWTSWFYHEGCEFRSVSFCQPQHPIGTSRICLKFIKVALPRSLPITTANVTGVLQSSRKRSWVQHHEVPRSSKNKEKIASFLAKRKGDLAPHKREKRGIVRLSIGSLGFRIPWFQTVKTTQAN